ncbi:MAG TPA: TlpA disulfide reductase family protein [Verrucomicrobiota bacterium]|nr:TlpA disulfide reductase family protein [Verrucomicrobiota bacterium]
MKTYIIALFTTLLLVASSRPSPAQETNTADFAAEVAAVTAQVDEKFSAGKTSASDMAASLKAISALIVKNQKTEDREQLAKLYMLIGRINRDALKNDMRTLGVFNQVIRDFPGTSAAAEASAQAHQLRAKIAAEDAAVPEGLEIGMRFPNFTETELAGKPLSLETYRGRVVLIDFWATWCGPCVAEMPNVIATYRKYQSAGFEIIGISLDSNRDKLTAFTKTRGMTWPQYFDGKGWDNKLSRKYGVNSIPMTYLLDARGRIIGKKLRGGDLEKAVAAALGQK